MSQTQWFGLDIPLSTAMRLFAGNALAGIADFAKEIGWITSATRSERLEKEIALGFVKRGWNEIGTQLAARSPNDPARTIALEIVALPFA